MVLLCTMLPNGPFSQIWWWFSMIYSVLFFIRLPTLLSEDHSNNRQLELQPAKNKYQEQSQILSTCHFQLAVMCLRWVEMWLCCEPWVLPVCFQAHTKTPTVYQNCTSQDHRYHTYSISRAQPSMLCVSFLLPGGEPPQPSEGSQSRLIQTDRHMSWGRHGCLSDSARSAEEDSTQFLKVSAHFISYETFLKNWMLKNIM